MDNLPEKRILRLTPQQIYPRGWALKPDFLGGDEEKIITKETPIASIGSCFAREIKFYLTRNSYNYVQTATGPNAEHGSAAWDRVYNTFCLKQEVRRAFDGFEPLEGYWHSRNMYLDPYRKAVAWKSLDERDAELQRHHQTARDALLRAKVLIMTVGLNEIWFSKEDGSVFFQIPPSDVYDEAKHAFKNGSVEENVANLEEIHRILGSYNPECKIIITVSPVPLRATFRPHNVVISNTLSKATLIVAVQQFVANHDNVYYFPSYELVTAVVKNAFKRDNRHVKHRVVTKIMKTFEKMFVAC